jgi:hypothetical protein
MVSETGVSVNYNGDRQVIQELLLAVAHIDWMRFINCSFHACPCVFDNVACKQGRLQAAVARSV